MTFRPHIAFGAAALVALFTFGSGAASAHGPAGYGPGPHYGAPHYVAPYPVTPHIDQRQARQQRRIAQGFRSGQLTPHEVRRLEQQQRHIRRMERRAKADGIVTRGERRHLDHAQDRASRSIRGQRHDRQHY